jgi:nitroreductase
LDKTAPAAHPIHPLLAARWSPRAFSARDVTEAELALLLEAARWASSCNNDQPWHYVVTRRGAEGHAALLATLSPNNQGWAQHAPLLLLACARGRFAHNGQPNRHAWYDVGQACANMAAQAAALGLQLHQMAGFDAAAARAACALPEEIEAVAAIAIGEPGDPAALPEALAAREVAERKRHPISAFAHHGKWSAA